MLRRVRGRGEVRKGIKRGGENANEDEKKKRREERRRRSERG